MTRNQLTYWQNVETERSNKAREKETHRSNVANEKETNRANLAREFETNRHNVVTEEETHRHNVAIEMITQQQADEQRRTNMANESIKNAQLLEQIRTNQANERIKEIQNDIGYANVEVGRLNAATNQFLAQETQRSHLANEAFNLMNLAERTDNNQRLAILQRDYQEEQARHNLESESIAHKQNSNKSLELAQQSFRDNEVARHNATTERETAKHNATVDTARKLLDLSGALKNAATIPEGLLNAGSNQLSKMKGALSW